MWEVGNGKEIKLWENKWVGNTNLKTKFPRLFSICLDKDFLLWQGGMLNENLIKVGLEV